MPYGKRTQRVAWNLRQYMYQTFTHVLQSGVVSINSQNDTTNIELVEKNYAFRQRLMHQIIKTIHEMAAIFILQ
jgi:hypothetical protein